MKKLICLSIALILISLPAFAIDVDKLDKAIDSLWQIKFQAEELIDRVTLAKQAEVRGIVLTAEQKKELRDFYDTNKENLVTLYQGLP